MMSGGPAASVAPCAKENPLMYFLFLWACGTRVRFVSLVEPFKMYI